MRTMRSGWSFFGLFTGEIDGCEIRSSSLSRALDPIAYDPGKQPPGG